MRRLLAILVLALLPLLAAADSLETPRRLFEGFDPNALAALQDLTRSEPGNAEAWSLLGRAQLRAGDAESAVESLERAVELEPERAERHYLLGQAYGSNINNVGMLSKLGYAGKIRDAFARAIELDPDHINSRFALLQFFLQAPGIAGGSEDKARAQAAEIAKRSVARGHAARAQLLQHEEKAAEAIAAWRDAVAADPSYAGSRLSLGISLHAAGNLDEAFEVFAAMQRELPEAGQGWYQFGRLAVLSEQRLEQGEASLRHYLGLPRAEGLPEPKHAHYRLGQVLALRGQVDAARTELQRALALDGSFKEAREALDALR